MIAEECHRCGDLTGETIAADDAEYPGYCPPCRDALVLPCPCGGIYGPTYAARFTGAAVRSCPDCGSVCAYWDDSDLVELPR